jgi:hypothetical protein
VTRTTDTKEIAVTQSAPPTDGEQLAGSTRFIARVLRHAHQKTMALNAPNDARGVLYVAHCFADELAVGNPRFDRLRFIQEATDQQS